MERKRVYIFVILSTRFTEIWAGWESMMVTTRQFTGCPDQPNQPNPMTNLSLHYLGEEHGYLISGDLKVTEVVSHGAMIDLEAQKCMDANDDTSCRFYHRFVIEFCSSLFQGSYWTKWLEAIEDFGPCPLQARTYRIAELPMDVNNGRHAWHVLSKPEQYVGHWKVIVRVTYKGEVKTCFQTAGDVKKRRRKSKKTTGSSSEATPQSPAGSVFSRGSANVGA